MTAVSQPKNANNAIEAALFVVALAQPLDPHTLARVGDALNTLAEDLPGGGVNGAMQPGSVIQLGAAMPSMFGAEVMRFKALPNGIHEWRVHVTGNMVQVSCLGFSDFGEVWNKAKRYLITALGALDAQAPVAEVGYQVVDKFEYPIGMTAQDYDMAELFRKDSELLTPQAWKSGLMWHVYQGWFEHQPLQAHRYLHQVNVSNTEGIANQVLNIVDHRVALRTTPDYGLSVHALTGEDGTSGRMDTLFSDFHQSNLSIIRKLLTPQKLLSIGMKEAE